MSGNQARKHQVMRFIPMVISLRSRVRSVAFKLGRCDDEAAPAAVRIL